MKKLALFALALLAGSGQVQAWEAQTTQAGLAEQAALSSGLHKRLVSLGFTGGLFEPLTIPPADAPALMKQLELLSPSHGSVPDKRGRQTALAWIAAGAALADIPARHAVHHFYDPATKKGWQSPERGVFAGLSDAVREAIGRASLPARGLPATEWITSKDNPFQLSAFMDQYGKAVSAATPGERSRHMAAALIAAGAMMHVLGDVGSPSRVRGDEAAHFEPLGGGPDDLGSRFERIAALAYGRLGVPAPSRVVTRARVRDFFTAADGSGLGDYVARSFFSSNTLPHSTRVGDDAKPTLVRPQPALPTRLNLMAASREDGTTLRNKAGTCLARYKVEHGVLSFHLDDECMLEQIAVILPEVAAYQTGLLELLLRGELQLIAAGGNVVVTGKDLGAGTVDVLVEDHLGVRKTVASSQFAGGKSELARVPAAAGTRVVAVFRGADSAGEPIVAVGTLPLAAQ
jgi:hypothetical protein